MKVPNNQPDPKETPVTTEPPEVEASKPTVDVLARFDVYMRSLELAGIVAGIDAVAHRRLQMVRAAESIVLDIGQAPGGGAGPHRGRPHRGLRQGARGRATRSP